MGEGLRSVDAEDCEFGYRIGRDVHDSVLSLDDSRLVLGKERAFPGLLWFEQSMVHFFLSWTGNFLVCVTCSGHIAAETINGHCLSCYTAFVFLLLLLEAVITTDIFLNRNWEADFPGDPTGRLDELKDFVQSNFELCKLISILVVVAQAVSIFLAMVLRSLGSDHDYYYHSDDDSVPARLPLLRNDAPNTHHIANATLFFKNHPWIVRIHDKIRSRN